MRHFLLALLIAMLPLRGWMGDAMAMAAEVHPATQAQAHPASPAHDSHADSHAVSRSPASLSTDAAVDRAANGPAQAPCDEHGGIAHAAAADRDSTNTASGSPHADGHHTTAGGETAETAHQHKSCDVCNGPAMALSSEPAATLPQPHQVQVATAVRFASTVLPQGIKPPIS